jgi:methyl-accepting chemotaxis protein PixJ
MNMQPHPTSSQLDTLDLSNPLDSKEFSSDPIRISSQNKGLSLVQNILANRVVETVSVSLTLSLVMLGGSAWNVWSTYQGFRETVKKEFRLQELSKNTTYYDEALTHSVNMAASTGDLKWASRYDSFVPKLDATLSEIIKDFPSAKDGFDQTKDATDKLYALEDQTFKLLRKGKQPDAAAILFGPDYAQQKQIYAQGADKTLDKLNKIIAQELETSNQRLTQSMVFAGVSFPLLMLTWVVILVAIRSYMKERTQAQQRLVESQGSLLQMNQELEHRTEQIEAQERITRQESELLQADVGVLLDTVCSIEEGDLRVQAPVSDRVTGLVSDTLNRLIEQLIQVMTQVLDTTEQVTFNSLQLEELACTVATNAEQQAQGVSQTLVLAEQVETTALASEVQVNDVNTSLGKVRETVDQGQQVMTHLKEGILVLHQGSEHIVQQMKTLGEFVGLADQFVQEQSQIASLTQVLAMNAGLVAARAAEQRDPRQFSVVAREFEAIARQVSDLAQQTNDGLNTLEQRTSQIHTVVSAIDTDVQGLSHLVNDFTQGVEQSNEVFTNVKLVTGSVSKAGEVIAQSNQDIVKAIRTTATAMRNIATLAVQTATLTQSAQSQSEQIELLSGQLLQRVLFFQLPTVPDLIAAENSIFQDYPAADPHLHSEATVPVTV